MLGLDLQGGIEVRLEPVGKQRPTAVLDKAVDIIRNRVNGLGVAETEVKRDGDQIVVDLPGVKDRDKARRLVGKTAELRFRPVLVRPVPVQGADDHDDRRRTSSTSSTTATSSTSADVVDHRRGGGPGKSIHARAPGDSTHHVDRGRRRPRRPPPPPRRPPPRPRATTATTAPATQAGLPPLTTPAQDKRNATVVLCDRDGKLRYELGPTALTGRLVTSANARFNSGGERLGRRARFNSVGQAKFNQLAAIVVQQDAAAERGRDRARRRGAVGAGVPDADASTATSRSRATSARATPRTSRRC